MIVTRKHSTEASYYTWRVEIAALLTVTYAFICPFPFHVQIMITAGVSLVVAVMDRILNATSFVGLESQQSEWINHLALRFGLDAAFKQPSSRDHSIDWFEATRAAVDDVKDQRSQDKMREQLSGGNGFTYLLYALAMPLGVIVRGMIGFYVARALWQYAPRFANWFLNGSFT